MVSFPTPTNISYNTFAGIRLRNGIVSKGIMSAEVCQNIDFIPQGISSNVKIQSSLGNTVRATYTGYNIVKAFESVQEGTRHLIVYAETNNNGILAHYTSGSFVTIVDGVTSGQTLSKTGKANGITMTDSAEDTFVFTNGKEYYSIRFNRSPVFVKLNPTYNSEATTGLAIAEQDGSLVIGSDKGYVLASRKGDITDWDYVTPSDTNKAWYQLFGKPVTAVAPYIGGLLIFTADDSTILTGNMSSASTATRKSASLGGCMSFESWVIHDKYLFFYDNNQKNVYFFSQNDYGQTKLGDPVAIEVQQLFDNISKFQFVSYISDNRNELWVLTNKDKFVLDYFQKEWTTRKYPDSMVITSFFVYDGYIFSTAGANILREKDGIIGQYGYVDNNNQGEFVESVYTTQTLNMGSYSNLKEMELPPILTVATNVENSFWLYALIDDKKTKSKKLFTTQNVYAKFYSGIGEVSSQSKWGQAKFAPDLERNVKQLKGKQIANYYTVKFTIKTEQKGQAFSISALELKQITQEVDTMGHK